MGGIIGTMVASFFFFFHSLMESIWMSLTISILVSIAIFNIYRLLIISFSVPTIPVPLEHGFPVYFARFARYVIVVLLALFIAQPLAIFVFKDYLVAPVSAYKEQQLAKLENELNQMHQDEVATINEIITYSNEADKVYYQDILKEKEVLHEKQLRIVSNLISSSNYFIFRIKELHKEGSKAFIFFQFFIVCLFYLPVFFKRRTQLYGDLMDLKKQYDVELVKKEHHKFKKLYQQKLLAYSESNDLAEYNIYKDPPFNTVLKEEAFKKQKTFIREFKTDKETAIEIGEYHFYLKSRFTAKFRSSMIPSEQDFDLKQIYEVKLHQPEEIKEQYFNVEENQNESFSRYFTLVTASLKNTSPDIPENDPNEYVIELDEAKILDIKIENTVQETNEVHGSLSGNLVAHLQYKNIEERKRRAYILSKKVNMAGKSLFTMVDNTFPGVIKVLYLIPVFVVLIGLLVLVHQYFGGLYLYTFLGLASLIYSRIKLNKSIKKNWIKVIMGIGIFAGFVILLAGVLTFLYKLVVEVL